MKVLTRGDLDGLTSTLLLTYVEQVKEIRFAHPKDVQDGLITVDQDDIIVNLPFVEGCGLWFDHHSSEDKKLEKIGKFKGAFAIAPSTARVIYDHYKNLAFEQHQELLVETDRLDSANLTVEDVSHPKDWILLGLTLDPRTGLGPEFQKYFRWLAEFIKEVPLNKILTHSEVKKRIDRVLADQEEFARILKGHTRLDGNVIVTDMRDVKDAPVGNRFIVFTLYPGANVEMRILRGKFGNTVTAIGHSIFNRTCNVDIGELMSRYGGGGHRGAGTAQLLNLQAEQVIAEILDILKKNQAI